MSKKIGRLISLGLNKESSRGTAEAATYWLPKANISFEDKATKALSTLNYGVIGEGNQELTALKYAEGNIEGDVLDKCFGLIFLATFGTLSTASFNGAYKHTYSLQNDNQHDSLTLHIEDGVDSSQDKYFELAMINNLELTVVPEDVVKFSANFMSKSSGDSVETSSYVAENKFLGKHCTIKLASLTSGLTAASGISVRQLTLNINKNLVMDHVLSTVQPEDIFNTKFEVTGQMELVMNDETYKNYMLDGTYRAMRIDIVNTDVTIGTTNPAIRLDLSRVAFDTWEATKPNDDLITETINFRAMYDITNGDIINDCYIVNEVSSY